MYNCNSVICKVNYVYCTTIGRNCKVPITFNNYCEVIYNLENIERFIVSDDGFKMRV